MLRRWAVTFVLALALPVAFAQEPPSAPAHTPPIAPAGHTPIDTEANVKGKTFGELVRPRSGDICIVCKRPMGSDGVVYLVNGQRVALHLTNCYAAFAKNPQLFLATLRPHGAFLGTDDEGTTPSWVWFIGGLYILVGLVFGALGAHRALYAGRNPAAWFAAGFFLNVFGYVWLLTRSRQTVLESVPGGLGKVASTYAPVPCSACGTLNHPAAERCIDCGAKLQAAFSSEAQREGLRSQ